MPQPISNTTAFGRRVRRLGLSLRQVQAWTGEPYGTVKRWSQGRSAAPPSVMRLLAVYRLLHWGQRADDQVDA